MKTELMLVTPKMAREWLNANTSNRPLRPNVVNGLMDAYKRGEWKVTHQGIAFAESGRLLDGQHRLSFIAELPEKTVVPMNVSTGMDEAIFDAIDQGLKRTLSDLYEVSGDLVAAARFFANLSDKSRKHSLTPQYVKPFIDWVRPEYELLISFCPKRSRMWSSAPVRAAAIYLIKSGHNKNFVRIAYDSLVNSNISAMPPACRLLAQQYMSGKIVSARGIDLFCRSLIAFDQANSGISRIVVHDGVNAIERVRDFILKEMKKSPDQAGETVAKPVAKFNWKRAA